MSAGIRKLLQGFIFFFLKTTFPLHDTAFIKFIFLWYRHTGIRIIQKFFPLFGNFVMLSLTSRCQCSCLHCGARSKSGNGGAGLDRTAFLGIIDESYKLGAYSIYFFGGEPLLVPELFEYIAYARTKGLSTRCDTNGLLLNEEMVVRLKKAGLDEIGISIDSLNEEIHDKNRGVKGTLNKALSGLSYCGKHNLKCYISTIATSLSLKNGDFRKIVRFAEDSGDRVRVLSPVNCGQWENRQDIALTPHDVHVLRSFLKRGTIYWDSELIDTKDSPFLCSAIARRMLFISSRGDVQPCCYFPVQFGNITKEPLGRILNRMRVSEYFLQGGKYSDCPTNVSHFQNKYRHCAGFASSHQGKQEKHRRSGKEAVEPVDYPSLSR
jgi:MoaA/NifB/PqqE/SkfB family radical SAM enzyme